MRLGEISYVHLQGRGAGKTYRQMTWVHDAMVAGERVLGVFPNLAQYEWWLSEWRRRFPQMRPPDYVTAQSVNRARGRRVTKIFVDNVEEFPDGIYDRAFETIWPCLDPTVQEAWEIYITANCLDLNWKSHNATVTKSDVLKRVAARLRQK